LILAPVMKAQIGCFPLKWCVMQATMHWEP